MLMNLFNITLWPQGYDNLWKQVDNAHEKDEPRTEIEILGHIIERAIEEKAYGQIVAASLRQATVEYRISPDSLSVRLDQLEQMETNAPNTPLQAIYSAVLSLIYRLHSNLDEDGKKRQFYMEKALSHPNILAQTKAGSYDPFIEKGVDSHLFGDDLLHVIGLELNKNQLLHDWYVSQGQREAACFLATDLAGSDLSKLDSIISAYEDLPVCGHAALARYNSMPQTTNAERRKCYDYLLQALNKWDTWKEKNDLRNALTKLTAAKFSAEISEPVIHPKQHLLLHLSDVRNLSALQVNVTRTQLRGDSKWVNEHNTIGKREYNLIKRFLDPSTTRSFNVSFQGKPSYELNTDSLQLPYLPCGVYLLEIETNDSTIEPQRLLFCVSNLRLIWQHQPKKKIRLVVVRADNGQPIPGAIVKCQNIVRDAQKGPTLTTDRFGEVIIPEGKEYSYLSYFCVSTPEDYSLPLVDASGVFNYNPDKKVKKCVRIFTDRSIYRPGQPVYVSLMAWTKRETETKTQQTTPFTLILRDANNREIARKEIITDDFGTATVEFQLPSSGLTGMYSICNEQTFESTFIQVEEYKRPTFEVNFDEYKDKYALGDTIFLQGTATTYSGLPVQGAHVRYTVVRRPALWWRWWNADHSVEVVSSDTTQTDDEGHFQARIPLLLGEKSSGFYNFEVRAHVTDMAGESHQGVMTLPVGSKESAISTDLAEKILADKPCSFTFQYRNVAGKNIAGTVSYAFFPSNGEMTKVEDNFSNLTFTAEANTPVRLPHLKSGGWTLLATCGNDTLRHEFVVFSLADKRPAVETHDWYYQTSDFFPQDGQPVCVQVGASDANQHIVYSIIAGDTVLENGRIDQSNALSLLKFKYKETYGNGLRLCFAWVHDGVCYEHSTTIKRPLPEKQLKLTWRTFRDRLTPGQQEEWTLEVKNPDDTPANALLMATLYDKSLDPLRPHQWSDEIDINQPLPWAKWNGCEFTVWPLWGDSNPTMLPSVSLLFSHFARKYYRDLLWDMDNVNYYCTEASPMRYVRNRMFKSAAIAPMAESEDMMDADKMKRDVGMKMLMVKDSIGSLPEENAEGGIDQTEKSSVQLRENLQETAFFYPQLRTDAKGIVSLQFRLPESVTTWRLMGLAHDREMRHGMIDAEVVAQKEVMVQPNLPRFIRVGDHAVVASRISNMGTEQRNGYAKMKLINPLNDSVFFEQELPFSVEVGKTVSVSFAVTPSSLEGHEGLAVVQITAQGDGFSDGEQHYLPILTCKKYVTSTLPFTQNHQGTLQLDLTSLFKGEQITQPKLTIEYTNNPSWLMLLALPYVGDANEKNAISLAASVYANALGKYIVKANPHIKTVFKLWENESGSENTLLSQLEKNEALKEMMLSETPWVCDALSETSQRKALASFFDENKIDMTLARATNKLQKLQHSNGSFSWWEGMDGSFPMTMAVTKMLTRLQVMVGKERTRSEILTKAFYFLDKEVAKSVEKMKERERGGEKDLFPDDVLCDYLYTNALAKRAHTQETDYLIGLLLKAPTILSIYGKANIAVILSQYGYTQKANEYLESLRQYTVYKEEMGRYFDTPRALYSWFDYRIPSQVAAIEALRRLAPTDTLFISEMQRWLLQSKRTQSWDTPLNAVNAIWAFSENGQMGLLSNSKEETRLSLDGKAISASSSAGLGYVRYTEALSSAPKTLSIEKQTVGTSWGAVYAQYLQPACEIQASSSGLTVSRDLLDKDGKPAVSLKVGDRVRVRITIIADRDYDFVAVEDMRAACLEPVTQWSGYRWGYYLEPRDQATRYFFNQLRKGKHVIETEYYIDRAGDYLSGTCTVQCAYAPEFSGRTGGKLVNVTQ